MKGASQREERGSFALQRILKSVELN